MIINDIKEYIQAEKERRWQAEGITVKEISEELKVTPRAAQKFVIKEVAAGRLKPNGVRYFIDSTGKTNHCKIYTVIPHEKQT